MPYQCHRRVRCPCVCSGRLGAILPAIAPFRFDRAHRPRICVVARQFRGEWSKWRFVYGFTWLATLAMLLTSAAVFPILNRKNSYAPFFEKVRDQSRNRELYTTLLDDRRLPLVEFYLDRRVPIIQEDEKLFQLLNSGASVGVILDQKNYERLKKAFALIPHQLIVPANDKPPLVLINNR